MAKWADFLISAVHYTIRDHKKYISQVHAHTDNGENVSSMFLLSREEVLNKMDQKLTFKTIYKKDNSWNKGEDVRKVKINNFYYLKTDANNKEEDNLENLPQF